MDGKLGWRLRAYTAIVGTRTIGAGAAYWLSAPRIRESPAFDIVREIAPLRTFAVVMVILGMLALGGVVHPNEKGLRVVMVGSFGLAFLFGLCVALGREGDEGADRKDRRAARPTDRPDPQHGPQTHRRLVHIEEHAAPLAGQVGVALVEVDADGVTADDLRRLQCGT